MARIQEEPKVTETLGNFPNNSQNKHYYVFPMYLNVAYKGMLDW